MYIEPPVGVNRNAKGAASFGLLAAVVLAALVFAPSVLAAAGETERVSVDSAGTEGNDQSTLPAINGDGRFVAFFSRASNLVSGDTNGVYDVFVRDRQTGTTERVSVDSSGNQSNAHAITSSNDLRASISADGRFVAFSSSASNLVAGDSNGVSDVFVHDRQTGTTERVSVDSTGSQASGRSNGPAISADGRFVSFASFAPDLVAGDTNGVPDIFVHDRQTGTTERVNVDSSGNQGDGTSEGESEFVSSISADGRFVAFGSDSSNLVAGDTNGITDIFVRDRQTSTTELVSVGATGPPPYERSSYPSISANGRFVSFTSNSSSLVADDTNGFSDVFVRDRQNSTTELVSTDSFGNLGNDGVAGPSSISADGRYVAFSSDARNLIPNHFGTTHVYVRDRQAGTTELISMDSVGNLGNSESYASAFGISADGRFVAFHSGSTNLVADDTNDWGDVFVHDRGTGAGPVESAGGDLLAGGTIETNATTTPDDPVGTAVTTPVAGEVTIDEDTTVTTPDPNAYTLFGAQVTISAPAATAASPLELRFLLDSSLLPAGADPSTLQVFRNGAPVPDCAVSAGGSASPDPCVSERAANGVGGVALTVRTSQASTWNFGLHTAYAFQGFHSPIAAPPALNGAKAGSALALRFSLGGNQGLTVAASGYPRSHAISCDAAASDLGGDAQAEGSLIYDPKSQRYTYTWKTLKGWASKSAPSCRQFVLRLNDGSVQRANFRFAK